jgi:hypothetical protein
VEFEILECKGYPGDEDFSGNIDLTMAPVPGESSESLYPRMWLMTPTGLELALGHGMAADNIDLTFFHDSWDEAYPDTVDLYYGCKESATLVATVKVET